MYKPTQNTESKVSDETFIKNQSSVICAVVVLYNPDRNILDIISNYLNIFSETILIFNSDIEPYKKFFIFNKNIKGLTIIRNSENKGIAYAMNQGIEYAVNKNFKWIFTFDQDSNPVSGFINESLLTAIRTKADIIGANFYEINSEKFKTPCNKSSANWIERKTVITSGMLLSAETIKKYGLFREDYFIDSVDHEYCLRVRKQGGKVVISCRSLLLHAIGEQHVNKLHIFLGYSHNAIRKYYMARNTTRTVLTYFANEPLWSFCQCIRLIIEAISICLLENNKRIKLNAFFIGLRHGLTNKMGPLNNHNLID